MTDNELAALWARDRISEDMRLGVLLLATIVVGIFGLGFLVGWLAT